MLSRRDTFVAFAPFLVSASLLACRPEIGDQCVVSTDCSTRGDRQCDTASPGGYCTVLNCRGDTCPDESSCILFNSAIPGCGYDDRNGGFGSRVSRSLCQRRCGSDADCRGGYVCVLPKDPPWNAINLDNDQQPLVCLPRPSVDAGASNTDAPVCKPVGPPTAPIDASAPRLRDGGPEDAGDGG